MIKKKGDFKLIITLGPASRNKEFLQFCQNNNLVNFRLNCSHLSPSEAEHYINFTQNIFKSEPVNFYLDLKGHKQRICELTKPLKLDTGQSIRILLNGQSGRDVISLPSAEIFNLIEPDDRLLLMDGTIQLKILMKNPDQIIGEVIQGGVLRSHSGIIIRGKALPEQEILKQENEYLNLAKRKNIKHIALSYVSKSQDIESIRKYSQQIAYSPVLTAKIERPEALKNLKGILKVADEIWYCRGDLGTFVPFDQLAIWQEKVIKQAKSEKIRVFIAGQVFQYLTYFPEPTRSELVHFYSLLKMGVNGIVLSDETAIGENPKIAVETILSLLKNYKSSS